LSYGNEKSIAGEICNPDLLQISLIESLISINIMYASKKAVNKGYTSMKYCIYAEQISAGMKSQLLIKNADGTLTLTRCCAVCGLGGNPYCDGGFEYYNGKK
jgi:unsaturated rhamnogalacturonyl hydrolase